MSLPIFRILDNNCGPMLLPYFNLVEATEIRLVCRSLYELIKKHQWDDKDAQVKHLLPWSRAFPQALSFRATMEFQFKSFREFELLKNCKFIDLCFNVSYLRDSDMQYLQNVQYLDLGNTNNNSIGDAGLKALTKIKTLRFKSHGVTDEGLRHLKGIHELSMENDLQITDAGISSLTSIYSLSIGPSASISLTDQAFLNIGAHLTVLSLSQLHNVVITDEALIASVALQQLYIDDCSKVVITNRGLAALSRVSVIRLTDLDGLVCDDEGFIQLKPLHLHLCCNENMKITDVGISAMAGLQSLVISNCLGLQISDEGLKSLDGIQSLDLSWNSHANIHITIMGLVALIGIKFLDLSETGVYFNREDVDFLQDSHINIDFLEYEDFIDEALMDEALMDEAFMDEDTELAYTEFMNENTYEFEVANLMTAENDSIS